MSSGQTDSVSGIHCKCDKCNQEWLLVAGDIREAKVLNVTDSIGLTAKYFTCPRCGKIYTINLFDNETRHLVKVLKRARKKFKKLLLEPTDFSSGKDKRRLEHFNARLESVNKKLKLRIAEVSKTYSGAFTLAQNGKDLLYQPYSEAEQE